jgi:hypothetical protein
MSGLMRSENDWFENHPMSCTPVVVNTTLLLIAIDVVCPIAP